jgi:hypothetical protein
VSIRGLRSSPELPDAYFAFRDAVEARILREPLFRRPSNVAVYHAIWAVELMVWKLRPLAEVEIMTRLAMGLVVEVGAFSMVIHGIGAGLTNLVRLLEQRAGTPTDVEPEPPLLREAESALITTNGLTELYIVLGDVEMGWRSCIVENRTIRVPSKSPERLVRSLQRSLNREAEQNELLIRRDDPREREFYERLRSVAAEQRAWFTPTPDLVAEALETFGPAWRRFSNPRVDDALMVQDRFTVDAYRRVAWALKAYAVVQQVVTDFQNPRPEPVMVRGDEAGWIDFAMSHAAVSEAIARQVLDLLVHSGGRDLRERGRVHAPMAYTPLIDSGDGTWSLAPTLAIWLDPELALRGMWKNRAPNDYNAKVSQLNNALSDEAGALFQQKGWVSIVRRNVDGSGDIDAGAGVRNDPFFICGECKVFIDDPLRRADDLIVWEQLDRLIRTLADPAVFTRVLGNEGLARGEIKGLVVVPGRAQTPIDLGDDYARVGLDDLRDFVQASGSPRDLWNLIKESETYIGIEIREVAEEVDGWTLISDGVLRPDLLRERDAPST